MQSTDLNLLTVLDALLQEGSVTGAARRLHLTPPAVSHALARLREVTGDPLLVRAGRTLVPTPVADRMRERAHEVVAAAQELLSPMGRPSDGDLERDLDATFTLRAGPDNGAGFGPALLAQVRQRAPRVRLRLVGDGDDAIPALRDGRVDLNIGNPVAGGHETVHREALLSDAMVVVGRRDGALARECGEHDPDPAQLVRVDHAAASSRGIAHGPLDDGLAEHGLHRTVVATAPGFAATFALVRDADLVCLAPERLTRAGRGADLRSWPSPVPLPPLVIEQLWHRRTHTDPAQLWLRDRVRDAVTSVGADLPAPGSPPTVGRA